MTSYVRISTGKIEIKRGEKVKIVTDKINGQVEKVIIDYSDSCTPEVNVVMMTSDGEEFLNVVGNKSGIYYPRNWNVMNQKYTGITIASQNVEPTNEKYVVDGSILILIEGAGQDDMMENIDIVIDGRIQHDVMEINESEWINSTLGKAVKYKSSSDEIIKEDSGVSSNTPGVFNPSHSQRRRELDKYIRQVMQQTMKETDVKLSIEKQDMGLSEILDELEDSLFGKKFGDISITTSDRIKQYMITALRKGYPLKRIADYIARKGNISSAAAEVIARTEIQALQNAVREFSLKKVDPEEKFKYKWIGARDDRICKACQWIIDTTKDGVKLAKLRGYVKEASGRYFPTIEKREWTVHPNDRCTFVRHFK